MSWKFLQKTVDALFEVKSGDTHATHELDVGNIPLVSCGATDNGLVGYFDIPQGQRYAHCITVAYNGSWPLLAKFHPYEFGAKDDVAVLEPRSPVKDTTLLYVAAILNTMTWRYSYGRKCFRGKLRNVLIPMPVAVGDAAGRICEDVIATFLPKTPVSYLPDRSQRQLAMVNPPRWVAFSVQDLFHIERGDFHSLAELDNGPNITVSRVTIDNGVVGRYERPDDAKLYFKGSITVSTVGGDAFVQLDDFIATDNVLILTPKRPVLVTTIFFVAGMLNLQKWRYSYGRQCYLTKFSADKVPLPVTEHGEPDEAHMKAVVENTGYWTTVATRIGTS